ncbi:MAG TPA: S4 domain-containing protein [Thermoanaerobaculia bacterium]|nr:S4 domain-containing protein [Thermoanaerobaculia bacterium]
MEERPAAESVRLDVWLDVSCLFPTRSAAKTACDGGKIDVNGARAKPHRQVRLGDRVAVARGSGQRRQLIVRGLASRSVSRKQARNLYEDVTPRVSPEVLEIRRLDRMLAPRGSRARPSSRERRDRRRQKGW